MSRWQAATTDWNCRLVEWVKFSACAIGHPLAPTVVFAVRGQRVLGQGETRTKGAGMTSSIRSIAILGMSDKAGVRV